MALLDQAEERSELSGGSGLVRLPRTDPARHGGAHQGARETQGTCLVAPRLGSGGRSLAGLRFHPQGQKEATGAQKRDVPMGSGNHSGAVWGGVEVGVTGSCQDPSELSCRRPTQGRGPSAPVSTAWSKQIEAPCRHRGGCGHHP